MFQPKKKSLIQDRILIVHIAGLLSFVIVVVAFAALYIQYRQLQDTQQEIQKSIENLSEEIGVVYTETRSLDEIQEELVLAVDELQDGSGATEQTLASIREGIEDRREQAQAQEITTIVKGWSDRVARVECVSYDKDDGDYSKATASGVAFYNGNILYVMTNKHLVEDEGEDLDECEIEFPQHDLDNINVEPEAIIVSSDRDLAYLRVTNPLVSVPIDRSQQACLAEPEIGDRVIALGFPRVGGRKQYHRNRWNYFRN